MADLKGKEYKKFEDIKHTEDGIEFWHARELAECLEYEKWANFNKVINRAMLSCKNSGYEVGDHFAEVGKLVSIGSKTKRKLKDYKLTRYACYLIVQNADPRKKVIALGQTYFAIQTRRQEVSDYYNKLDENNKRLVVRGDIKQWNQMLAESAHNAGVITDKQFATFQNAGYMGLYGGETVEDIHKRKGLAKKQKILDYMNSQELIANLFRISLADEKLKKEKINNSEDANVIHNKVGQEVRAAIKRVGGVLPENQPTPEKSIDEIAKEQINKLKKKKKLMLDE